MTAQEVLAKILEAGGQVIPDPHRPRLLVPSALKPLVAEHRDALRELVRQLPRLIPPLPAPIPALRRSLRAWYVMMAREAAGGLPTVEETRIILLSEIRRLWDDVGPTFAEAVERQDARAYHRETGRCPFCGEIGVFHDPDRGGEPA